MTGKDEYERFFRERDKFRFRPSRNDDVEAWLRRWRDSFHDVEEWNAINDMLDDYRAHADTGTPLDAVIREKKTGDND